MPDLPDLNALAQSYAQGRVTEATGPLVAQVQELTGQLTATRAELDALQDAYDAHMATHEPTPPPTRKKVIGMSAPAATWDQRLSEVGPTGIRARRIFADLAEGARDKESTIREAVADGMIPVVSYKVGGQLAGAIGGQFDAVAGQAATFLDSLGVEVAATVWHEPMGNMSGPDFLRLSKRLLPILRRGKVKVGPILNSFQVFTARGRTEFATYTDAAVLNGLYDYFGFDTYRDDHPGSAVAPIVQYLTGMGAPNIPLLVGEYNAPTGDAIRKAGETFLSTPTLWIACCWNSTGTGNAEAVPLSGDRLAAFKATKADPRALQ